MAIKEYVAIVCGAPSSEMEAPFEDDKYDVWVLGNRADRYPRFDRIFEIHDDLSKYTVEYIEFLLDFNVPIVVGSNSPLLGNKDVEEYPFEYVREKWGGNYLTSSSAYMLAYACLDPVITRVAIYGVDMAVDDHEYFWQRPCMEAWCGYAKGIGIDLWIHPKSPLLRSDYIEGEGHGSRPDFAKPPFTQKAFLEHAEIHQAEMNNAQNQINQLNLVLEAHNGARQVYERLAKTARAVEAGQDIKSLRDQVVIASE